MQCFPWDVSPQPPVYVTIQLLHDPLASTGYHGGTLPNAINDAGEIAGTYVDSQKTSRGFVYRAAAHSRENNSSAPNTGQEFGPTQRSCAFFTVEDPLESTQTNITGINNRGQIVGRYWTSSSLSVSYGLLATPVPDRDER